MKTMILKRESRLCLYDNLYTDYVEGCLLVYNPISTKGVIVLNKAATYLYNIIDNKKNLNDLYLLAKKKDFQVGFSDIKKTVEDLLVSEIIYIDKARLSLRKTIRQSPKISVWFHLTNQCNLRCKYCFVWKTSDKMTREIAEKAINKLLKDAQKHGFKQVHINFSGGECLLEFPMIFYLVNYGNSAANKIGIKISFGILTNGVLITDEVARFCKKQHISVGVSLDGLNKFHDKQRVFRDGTGSFKYVINGIDKLKKYGVVFNAMVTLTSINIEHLPELVGFFLKNKINFNLSLYKESPCALKNLDFTNKEIVKYLLRALRVIYNYPVTKNIINDLVDRISFNLPRQVGCGVGRNYLTIRQDGKIISCPMTIDQAIGSINDEDIIKKVKAGSFIRPRNLTVEYKNPCATCQWKYACGGGCPLITHKQKGTYMSSSPHCYIYKAVIPQLLKIESKRLIKYGKII